MSETVTMTLTEFLLARIAEDEANIRRPHFQTGGINWLDYDGYDVLAIGEDRLKAECEAKRRIVEQHCGTRDTGLDTAVGRIWECVGCGQKAPCLTIRYLASAYADHADYREEWRP